MKTILFQGDSITDADRNRNDIHGYGTGYPLLIAAELGRKCPGEYTFINKGISGNRIVDLYARIKADIINLAPDYMSILIGVNDVWHDLDGNGVADRKFEKIYTMLIEEVKEALPNIEIVILEPFVLHGRYTNERYDDFFRPEVALRAASSKRVAEKFSLNFVPLQSIFDALYLTQPEGYWLKDGVHPTAAGHAVIAKELLKTFKN